MSSTCQNAQLSSSMPKLCGVSSATDVRRALLLHIGLLLFSTLCIVYGVKHLLYGQRFARFLITCLAPYRHYALSLAQHVVALRVLLPLAEMCAGLLLLVPAMRTMVLLCAVVYTTVSATIQLAGLVSCGNCGASAGITWGTVSATALCLLLAMIMLVYKDKRRSAA